MRLQCPRPAGSSNGRTPDSESGSLGSSPSPAAFEKPRKRRAFVFLQGDCASSRCYASIESVLRPGGGLRRSPALPLPCAGMRYFDRAQSRIPQPWRTILDWLLTLTLAGGFLLVFEAEVAKPYRIP